MSLSVLLVLVLLLSTQSVAGGAATGTPIDATTGAANRAGAEGIDPSSVPSLTLHDLLAQVENRLIEVRRIELRRAEARAELDHLRVSRAFEVDVKGNYREEDVDRFEVNGNRLKQGRSIDIRRGLTFSVTRPLLGHSLEERLLAASEQQRLVELGESELITRREALLEVIGLYVDLAAEQRRRPLLERAIDLDTEKIRILEARHEQGESLRRDLLQANRDLALHQADLASCIRRQAELYAQLGEWVDGVPPGEFMATELDWARMREAPSGSKGPAEASRRTSGGQGFGGALSSRIWYNLPEIDLTFFYTMGSRDRHFADEIDREQGHTPGVELSLEFPLDVWRSGRSFIRQVEARAERQRLAILALERRTSGRAREVELAHAEAAARVAAAEADLALREEENRIARLLASDKADSVTAAGPKAPEKSAPATASVQLEAVGAEIAVITSRIALFRSQGELARRYFERAMIHGADPKEIALVMSRPPAQVGWQTTTSAPYALDSRR